MNINDKLVTLIQSLEEKWKFGMVESELNTMCTLFFKNHENGNADAYIDFLYKLIIDHAKK